ncbi:cytochrome P450 oxidoreductase [Bisporella sp. PMI_857]|nr:cytochrome P450 oxidoreductase [Bisporella sp. PMI_857]
MVAGSLVDTLWHNWPVVLFVALAAYFVNNHFTRGLNKYPGPVLASFTDWWRLWDVYKRRPEVTHIKLHEQHGDIVRLGPNVLSFSNPKALKAIYGLNKGFTKSEFYPVQQSVSNGHRLPSLFSTTDETFHAQLRRSVNSAFSMSTLIQYEPFVDNSTRLFLSQTERLFASTQAPCNFSQWLQFYAFDVIGEMTYSKRHGFLDENKDIDGIVGYIANLFDYVAPIGQMPILDLILHKNPIYLFASRRGLFSSTMPVATFAKSRMAERFSSSSLDHKPFETEHPDLLSKFIKSKEAHPEFMTDKLVTTMAVSMAFAGSETTAISLSSVFYYLLKNPRCMAKLLEELAQGEFEDNEEGLVTWTEAQRLTYLDAVVKESFRLHPAPGLPLERIVPPQGTEICGEFIKGGTIVGVSAWVLHRRREIFGEDVEAFCPERWLPDSTKDLAAEQKRINTMSSTLLHFGMGSRTCIGKNISLLEIYKLVPTVLRRFEVRLEDPSKDWILHNAWFVRQLGFRTVFKRRPVLGKEA